MNLKTAEKTFYRCKQRTRNYLTIGLASSIFALSCGHKDKATNPVYTEIPVTHVLVEEDTKKISSVEKNKLTFSKKVDYSKGEIIIAEESEETPNGLLRKIEAVSDNVIYTRQAALEEVVKEGHFEFKGKLFPANSESYAKKGISLVEDPFFDINLKFDNTALYNSPSGQIVVDGLINLILDYEIKVDISDWNLKEFNSLVTAEGKYNIYLNSSISNKFLNNIVSHDNLIPLAPIVMGTLPPPLPPIPITAHPKIGLDVGVFGTLDNFETGIFQETKFKAGLIYANNKWKLIAQVSNDFNFSPPKMDSFLSDFKIFASPNLKLFLYDSAGPYAYFPGSLGVDIEPKKKEFYGGLEALLGVQMEVFSLNVADYSKKVFKSRKVLARKMLDEKGGTREIGGGEDQNAEGQGKEDRGEVSEQVNSLVETCDDWCSNEQVNDWCDFELAVDTGRGSCYGFANSPLYTNLGVKKCSAIDCNNRPVEDNTCIEGLGGIWDTPNPEGQCDPINGIIRLVVNPTDEPLVPGQVCCVE